MGFYDYNKLQLSAKLVLSDSGTISEESSILGFDALNIREAHERPEAMESGVVMMVGLDLDRVLQAIHLLEKGASGGAKCNRVVDYEIENVAFNVVKIIHSYVSYINQVVWKK